MTEFKYCMYIDHELSPEEMAQVESHLVLCRECRELVDALRAENRVLTEVLQAVEAETVAVRNDWRAALTMVLGFSSMVAVAAGVVAAVTWVSGLLPDAVQLNLFNWTAWMDLFFSGAFYLANEGTNIMSSIIAVLAIVVVALLVGGSLYVFGRRSSSVALLAGLGLAFAFAPSASAIEVRHGGNVTVPSGETVEGNLLAGGENVTVEGTVNGDLITWARHVIVRGMVKGDVIDFSQNLDIEGKAEGDIYVFAQSLNLHGSVQRSVYAFARGVQLYSGSQVGGDLVIGCAEAMIAGGLARDAAIFCGSADLRGNVGRNVWARVGNIALIAPARVGGNLVAHVSRKDRVQIEPGATVLGKTDIELTRRITNRYLRPGFYFGQVLRLVAALVTGVVLFALWPLLFPIRIGSAGRILKAVGIGFLILVATPVGVLIAAVTVVGLPIGIIGLLIWLVLLYLAKIFVAAVIGRGILGDPSPAAPARIGPIALALLVGLVLLFVGFNLPYVGKIIEFVVLLLGLGLAFRQFYNRDRTTAVVAR